MGGIGLTRQARENLNRAIKDGETRHLPDAGGRWKNYCDHARVVIERFLTPQEIIHYVQSANTGFETRQTGQALIDHARSMDMACESMFPEFAEHIPTFVETPLSTPDTAMVLQGRLVSAPLLWHMRIIMGIVRHCRPRTILEIGGGYGAPGRVWMTNGLHRPDIYIDVDFPESLFYAEVYLRSAAPDIDVVYLHEGVALDPAHRPRIVLCPIANMEAVLGLPIDLIVNTGSMQEMSDEYVAFYMDKIERSTAKRFYSLNYFSLPFAGRHESMNMAAPTMGRDWSTELEVLHPAERPNTAEILFLRTGETPDALCVAEAALSREPPTDAAAFLSLFNAVRRVDRSDLLMDAAAKAVLGMPYVPKEALWLARRAAPTSATGKVVLRMLEQMAAESDLYQIQDRTVSGRIDDDKLLVDGICFSIVDRSGGSIEAVMELVGAAEVAGWAGDSRSNRPASAIVAAVNGIVVARTAPVGRRQDIEAGYGSGIQPAQFTMRVPLPEACPGSVPLIRTFALTVDNKAAPLDAGVSSQPFARFAD